MNEILVMGSWVLTGIGVLYAIVGAVDLFRPLSNNRP
jgi:hypothetical protein